MSVGPNNKERTFDILMTTISATSSFLAAVRLIKEVAIAVPNHGL